MLYEDLNIFIQYVIKKDMHSNYGKEEDEDAPSDA